MALILNDEIIEKMEEIYKSQGKPRYYKWLVDLNYQHEWLDKLLEKHEADINVVDVCQEEDNFVLFCKGDKDIIVCVDMGLLVYARNNKFKHMLILKGADDDL
jgi:hypothetical protein